MVYTLNRSCPTPVSTLIEAIKYGIPRADPQGTSAIMYEIEMYKNGKAYQLEVLYDKATNTIYRFVYKWGKYDQERRVLLIIENV